MELEYMELWCWLIPLGVGLICGLFGYLIGKGANPSLDLEADIILLRDKNEKLTTDLEACNKKLTSRPAIAAATGPKFNAKAAKIAFGKLVKNDDLKLIEGIGPKIQGLFHNYEIKTWKALSQVSVAKCQEVLDSGGDRYKVHDPASWPMQAKMAYEGKWKELAKWQHEHKHGKL
jgi:predicted flap endonuclease-1-like 5' DNA nuclease